MTFMETGVGQCSAKTFNQTQAFAQLCNFIVHVSTCLVFDDVVADIVLLVEDLHTEDVACGTVGF